MKLHRLMAWIWAFIVVLLLAHNAYLWGWKKAQPETDIMALLPVQERDPVLQQSFSHMVDAAQQRIVVLVGAPDWEQAKLAADAYRKVIATSGDFLIVNNINDQTQNNWLELFQQHRSNLLTAQQVQQLQTQTPQFWEEVALTKLYGSFSGPKLGAFQDDPFGLFDAWVQERAQETPVRPREGYLFVADASWQYVLLPMTLKSSPFSMGVQDEALSLLSRANTAAKKITPNAQVISAGMILHAATAAKQASKEVSSIGVGSLLGTILLMWLIFRSFKSILYVQISILVGCLAAISLCWEIFGSLHFMTLIFGTSLIGVAQDFGIYFLCNRLSADPHQDSFQLVKKLFPSLILTLITSVVAYLGLALTPFPGLRHMAVFSVLGLLFSWLTVVCWFPYLVSVNTVKTGDLMRQYSRAFFYWPKWEGNRRDLFIWLGFVLIAIFSAFRLGANDDIRLLQTPSKSLVEDQIKLGKLLDVPTPVQYFLVRGLSAEIVLQREELLKKKLEILMTQKRITGYQAISNWVPSIQTQHANNQLIQDKLLYDDGPLSRLANSIEEDASWAGHVKTHLQKSNSILSLNDFLQSPSSEPWRHLWLDKVGNEYASIVALRGVNYANDGLNALQKAGTGIDGIQWVDKVGEISSVLGAYRVYMTWAILGAYLIVFALLYYRYRRHAWRVLLPTLVGSVVVLIFFGLTGQDLQLFHVLALMLLLGIGVDYGIFMQEHAGRHNPVPWLATGLSAASTILSFGLLALSNTPALQSFGLTILIGISAIWLVVPYFTLSDENRHANITAL